MLVSPVHRSVSTGASPLAALVGQRSIRRHVRERPDGHLPRGHRYRGSSRTSAGISRPRGCRQVQAVSLRPAACRDPGHSDLGSGVRVPGVGQQAPGDRVRRPSRQPVRRRRPSLVADSLVGPVRAPGRPDHPLPAGQRGALAGVRLPNRRTARGPRAPRHHPRRPGDAEPGRRARTRGSPDRDRWRPRSADCAPGQEGRPAHGPDRHGLGRQLRGDQQSAGITSARRVLDHGGRRSGGHDPESGRAARTARLGDRRARVRRTRQLDRTRGVLADPHLGAAGGEPDNRHHGLGPRHRRGRRAAGMGDSVDRSVGSVRLCT